MTADKIKGKDLLSMIYFLTLIENQAKQKTKEKK